MLLLLNAAGILLERSFTPYLVATLLNFSVTVLSFVRLLQSAVHSPERTG